MKLKRRYFSNVSPMERSLLYLRPIPAKAIIEQTLKGRKENKNGMGCMDYQVLLTVLHC